MAVSIRYKEYGFEIGIKNQQTGQVIAGDVVECHKQDYKLRTAKIASAILSKLILTAQEA